MKIERSNILSIQSLTYLSYFSAIWPDVAPPERLRIRERTSRAIARTRSWPQDPRPRPRWNAGAQSVHTRKKCRLHYPGRHRRTHLSHLRHETTRRRVLPIGDGEALWGRHLHCFALKVCGLADGHDGPLGPHHGSPLPWALHLRQRHLRKGHGSARSQHERHNHHWQFTDSLHDAARVRPPYCLLVRWPARPRPLRLHSDAGRDE